MAQQGIGRFNLFGHDDDAARQRKLALLELRHLMYAQRQRVGTALEGMERRIAGRQRELGNEQFAVIQRGSGGEVVYTQAEQPFALSSEAARLRRHWE